MTDNSDTVENGLHDLTLNTLNETINKPIDHGVYIISPVITGGTLVTNNIPRDVYEKNISNHRCYFCGIKMRYPEVHHVNHDHNDHSEGNIVPACYICHRTNHLDATYGSGLDMMISDIPQNILNYLQNQFLILVGLEKKFQEYNGEDVQVQFFLRKVHQILIQNESDEFRRSALEKNINIDDNNGIIEYLKESIENAIRILRKYVFRPENRVYDKMLINRDNHLHKIITSGAEEPYYEIAKNDFINYDMNSSVGDKTETVINFIYMINKMKPEDFVSIINNTALKMMGDDREVNIKNIAQYAVKEVFDNISTIDSIKKENIGKVLKILGGYFLKDQYYKDHFNQSFIDFINSIKSVVDENPFTNQEKDALKYIILYFFNENFNGSIKQGDLDIDFVLKFRESVYKGYYQYYSGLSKIFSTIEGQDLKNSVLQHVTINRLLNNSFPEINLDMSTTDESQLEFNRLLEAKLLEIKQYVLKKPQIFLDLERMFSSQITKSVDLTNNHFNDISIKTDLNYMVLYHDLYKSFFSLSYDLDNRGVIDANNYGASFSSKSSDNKTGTYEKKSLLSKNILTSFEWEYINNRIISIFIDIFSPKEISNTQEKSEEEKNNGKKFGLFGKKDSSDGEGTEEEEKKSNGFCVFDCRNIDYVKERIEYTQKFVIDNFRTVYAPIFATNYNIEEVLNNEEAIEYLESHINDLIESNYNELFEKAILNMNKA